MSKLLRLSLHGQKRPRLLLAGYQRPVPAGRCLADLRGETPGLGRLQPWGTICMRVRHYLAGSLLMLSACGEATDAAPPKQQPATQAAAATRFDIAGVAVGDSLTSATAALKERGFTVEIFTGGWSFDDHVNASRAKAEGRLANPKVDAPKRLQARKGVEAIYAEMRATGDGNVIEMVSYSAPANGRPAEQLIQEVKTRYASGVQPRPGSDRLCAKSDAACTGRQPAQNYVTFDARDPFQITLFAGSEQQRRWRSDFEASLRKRLGPAPSSF